MIPFPFQAGQLGQPLRPTAAPAVTLRVAGTMTINGANTSVDVITPSAPAPSAGDLMIAIVMRRSAPASDPPSGWTLISSSGPATDGVGTNQTTYVYTKTSAGTEGGTNVTFSQASSGRIIGQIIVLTGNTGTPQLDGSVSTNVVNSTSTNTISLQSISASGDGRLGVAVGSFISSTPSPTNTTISADSGWTIQSPAAIDQNRVGVFTKSLSSGQNTSGTVTASFAATTTGTTTHSLIFKAP